MNTIYQIEDGDGTGYCVMQDLTMARHCAQSTADETGEACYLWIPGQPNPEEFTPNPEAY